MDFNTCAHCKTAFQPGEARNAGNSITRLRGESGLFHLSCLTWTNAKEKQMLRDSYIQLRDAHQERADSEQDSANAYERKIETLDSIRD